MISSSLSKAAIKICFHFFPLLIITEMNLKDLCSAVHSFKTLNTNPLILDCATLKLVTSEITSLKEGLEIFYMHLER